MTTSGRQTVRCAAGVLLAMTVGCRGPEAPTPPIPAPAPPSQPLIGQDEHQKNLQTMISVLGNAYWRGRPPDELRLEPLDLVVGRLTDPAILSSDRTARSRRRRAIATLAAYGLGSPPIDAALRALGAPVDIIMTRVREQERLLGPAFSENADVRETFIADIPEVSGDPHTAATDDRERDANCWSSMSTRIYPGRQVSIVVDVEAKNSVRGVAKGLDPQSWDQCGTAWKTGNGTFLAHLDAANNVVRDPEIVPPGQAYSTRTLYENFVCQVSFCSANFELFLGLWTAWTSDLYHVEFWLTSGGGYPKGTVWGATETLLVDQGNLEVKPSGTGTSLVHGEKAVAFLSESRTGAMFTYLEKTELAKELGELACCFLED